MRTRRTAAWLALLAIALQALFPLLAQAQARRVALVTICSASEPGRTVEIPLHEPAPAEKHCSLCLVGGDTPLLFALPEIPAGTAVACTLSVLSAFPSFQDPFNRPHPRAPPFLA